MVNLPVRGQRDWDDELNNALNQMDASAEDAKSKANAAVSTANNALNIAQSVQGAVIGGEDVAVAGIVGDDASASSEALGAAAANAGHPLGAALSATYGRGISVAAFGAVGDGVTNDRVAIQAALNSLPTGGGTVFFPNPKPGEFYAVDGTLTLPNGATLIGESSTRTLIREVGAADLFAPTTLVREVVFRNLSIQSVGGHMFNLGATGALALATFDDCSFIAYADGVSVMKLDGSGDLIGVRFHNCDFTRFGTATVPGFDLRNTAGGMNGNSWEKCRVTSNGATSTPYWRLRADAVGTYTDQNVFRDIIGQLNPGGLIEVDSPFMLDIENVLDYDVPGDYSRSLVKIGKALGGFPGPIRASNVGNRGGTMNGTTVFQLEISAATVLSPIIDRVTDSLGNRYVSTAGGYGVTTIDASGASSILTTSAASKTIDKTAEGTVVFNGSSLTATLPDPTTIYSGRVFVVKNIHSTSLTVDSAGTSKTIDGAASKSLAQWAVGRYASDGTQWLTV